MSSVDESNATAMPAGRGDSQGGGNAQPDRTPTAADAGTPAGSTAVPASATALGADGDGDAAPAAPPGTAATSSHGRLKAVSIVSGLLAFLLFCTTPFLPVNQVQSSFSWPQGGDLTSVTAPLVSYSPESVDITLPISEARQLNPGSTTILATVPPDATQASLRGLFVRSTDAGIDVVIRNVVALSVPKEELARLPKDAKLRITSDYQATKVWIPDAQREDGSPIEGTIPVDIRPMLTGIYSEMLNTPENAAKAQQAGLDVNVKVDSRFTSSPTPLKLAAMLLGGLLTLISLVALHRMDTLDGRPGRGRLFPRGWWRPRVLDGVVGSVLLIWYFIGANTADDGYLLTMAKASRESGYMANYYRWFGVPESPFGAPYYDLLALMAQINASSVWMRLPGFLAGLVTWLVISREVMPRLGVKINQRAVARWTAAAVFLLFWMVYNNGTRPEPIIALFSILTWVSFERAIATRRLLPAAVGTILATLALGAGPTGLIAVAALLASFGTLLRIVVRRLPLLGAPKGSSVGRVFIALLAQFAPFFAAGTAILTAVFGDQTLRTVLEAIAARSDRGPAMSWYEEYFRYTALLEPTPDGSFPRRYAVLMMMFCFGVVVASMLRNGGRVPGAAKGPSTRLVLVMLGTMFFLTFTPTKWTHHFGVYAGIGAAVAALAAVAASHMALRSRRNRILFIGATLLLFAFTLSGTNGWWYVSSLGVPWWDKTVQIKGIEASSVMLVLSLLVLAWGVVVGYLSDARTARAQTNRDLERIRREERRRLRRFTGLAAAPIGVLTALVVVFCLASLAKGLVSQWPAYSVGKGNLMSLVGDGCELASDVRVEKNTNDSFLPVADGSKLADSLTTGAETAKKDANQDQAKTDAKSEAKTEAKDSSAAPESRGFGPNGLPARISEGTEGGSSTMPQSSSSSKLYENSDGSGSTSTSDGTSSGKKATDGTPGSTSATVGDGNQQQKDDSPAGTANTSGSNTNFADSGNTGGTASTPGVNGSYATLPFGLDRQRVPVVGSFSPGLQQPAQTTTKWFTLPQRDPQHPLVVFSLAGPMAHFDLNGVFQYGQDVKVQFGKLAPGKDPKSPDAFEVLGDFVPLDVGTGPEWRNVRVPMSVIPTDATAIRIQATDLNLTPDQWLAITPPRAPELVSLNDYLSKDEPGLLDWTAALQFPCQRPYSHYAGVAELPKFRISPDHSARRTHSPVMDYFGGGSVGLMEMSTTSVEVPTYLQDDWQRDWGVLNRLTPFKSSTGQNPKPAKLNEEQIERSGLWYNGPIKYSGNY